MDDLDFITDASLSKTIKDSIDYIYVLFEDSKKKTDNQLFIEETYRVIILYVVSVIEAVLFYLYKKGGYTMTYLDYKYIVPLPEQYTHEGNKGSSIVVAVQKSVSKDEHKIGLADLIKYFQDEGLILKPTAEKILEINNLRNTFHLNKPRRDVVCDINQVERALKLLVYVIQRAPKGLPPRKSA